MMTLTLKQAHEMTHAQLSAEIARLRNPVVEAASVIQVYRQLVYTGEVTPSGEIPNKQALEEIRQMDRWLKRARQK